MNDERQIRDLLEQVLDSGRTPEQVCAPCPQLLPELRARLDRVRQVGADLDVLFPRANVPPQPAALPRIEGYEVEAVLGRGGMGVVYRARHLQLGRTVALKMLLHGACASEAEQKRLLREARATSALQHPNIVQVYDVGESGGLPFFTMELVSGGNLAQQLQGAPRPAQAAAALVATLAGAVHCAHEHGIVHRDLKPANVLLAADGSPKVSDFGLARSFSGGDTITGHGARVGTPGFMAPEQVLGRNDAVGPAADVYALGAILYQALTGRPPFLAESALETERQVVHQDPVPPSRLNSRVPRDLETICLQCLHKEPRRRYPTALALADELQRFQRGEPITAVRAGPLGRLVKWVRRRPAHATVLLLSTILVLTVFGGAVWLQAQRSLNESAAAADLDVVAAHQRAGAWDEARRELAQAEARLLGGGPAALRERIGAAARELDLVDRLQAIRRARGFGGDHDTQQPATDRAYEAAFATAGIGKVGEDTAEVARRIRDSNCRLALVAALDDWNYCVSAKPRLQWLLEVARAADPDPWRDRMRTPRLWNDASALQDLAATATLAEQPPTLLLMLAQLLENQGIPSLGLQRRIQFAHPSDFWANFCLAQRLHEAANPEAVAYYRAALALRPTEVAALVNLGIALDAAARHQDAEDCWQRALAIDPGSSMARLSLATTALNGGRTDEAIVLFREIVRRDPSFPFPYGGLGLALKKQGDIEGARTALRQAVQHIPKFSAAALRIYAGQLHQCNLASTDGPRLRAVLDGATPADAEECLALAELLYEGQQRDTALRLFQAAFARTQAPSDPDAIHHRYHAACCASVLAASTGAAEERARLRAQAATWLGEDLTAMRAEIQDVAVRAEQADLLDDWTRDPDLVAIREANNLAQLEAEERKRCQELWRAVAVQTAALRSPH
jgi:serine/threonine-protein kinase